MVHFLAEKIAVFLFDENDRYPIEVYIYGLELLVSSFIGTLLTLLLGLLSGYFLETVIFTVSLSAIRFFSGGYHAKTYLRCNAIYLISCVLSILFYRFVLLNMKDEVYLSGAVILLLTAAIMLLFAPVENENKKIEESKKKKFKVISVSIAVFELLIALLIYYFFGFSQALVILPTAAVVDIAMLAQILLCKRRNKNEKDREKSQGFS